MLSRHNRVTSREFDEAIKKGRVLHSTFFIVRVMAFDGKNTKIAAVAPAKIAKTSVSRHRVRRRIYAAAKPFVNAIKGVFVVLLVAKQPVLDADSSVLSEAVKDIFVKAGLLR